VIVKRYIIPTIIFLFLLIPITIEFNHKYDITIHNNSDETIIAYVYRIDHKLKKLGDFMSGVAEIKPDKEWTVNKPEGLYRITLMRAKDSKFILESNGFILNDDIYLNWPHSRL
jgi:hypothetical protein